MTENISYYDFIIAGGGPAGLSLAWQIAHTPELAQKSILIIDRDLSPENDKTWCFWYNGTPPFQDLIQKSWSKILIGLNDEKIDTSLITYPYHCIRSGDFKQRLLSELNGLPLVTILEDDIQKLGGDTKQAHLQTNTIEFRAEYIFQSCFKPFYRVKPEYPLLQHFLGWEVTTSEPQFDSDYFTLMDLDPSYTNGLAFMYILPWTRTKALFEYTIFSKETESAKTYEDKIELYLHNRYGLKILDYQIERTEFGIIPMEDGMIDPWYAPRVYNIGMTAGITKASTGYTFQRIQKHTNEIVNALLTTGKPDSSYPFSSLRYRWYDLWLLQILHDHPTDGTRLFYHLFKNNSPDDIFSFLGEESSFPKDLKIMSSVPWWPFFRAIGKSFRQMGLLLRA